jgi:WD40 repeat protein
MKVLAGHTDTVSMVRWSPDGQRIASASNDGTLRLWDAGTGAEVAILNGHTHRVRSVDWSPDGRRLASASEDGTVRVWSSSGNQLRLLHRPKRVPWVVAWCPDGGRLAVAEEFGSIRLWNAENGKEAGPSEFERPADYSSHTAFSLAWSPNGKQLAAPRLEDNLIEVLDATTGKRRQLLWSEYSRFAGVRTLAWSPDGRRLAGNVGQVVCVWDLRTGKHSRALKGITGLSAIAWSPDGKQLIAGHEDGTILAWDVTEQ